eukprot:CAMPEP_0176183508 /NCGR_PEP_ID=MMETSP0121_2-20121125/326_1 /TAXON_ID=160619 /ORGANISM="Kryptoperidinium foliaceum, Strain CCMP 1326" /LENGTH=91 /DNA_ID=CAMNT_0017521835 /DNA_START=51 /DNA_END=322 /DNA_ORIENTATION=+
MLVGVARHHKVCPHMSLPLLLHVTRSSPRSWIAQACSKFLSWAYILITNRRPSSQGHSLLPKAIEPDSWRRFETGIGPRSAGEVAPRSNDT